MESMKALRDVLRAASIAVLASAAGLWAEQTEVARRAAADGEGEEEILVRDEIEVLGEWPANPSVVRRDREHLPAVPIGDGADLLRGISGVAVGRMGGHGLEPRIRGLGESNLNIVIDGAYVHGGCPNRMDPPSSFASPSGFDQVTVLKGVQSMRYGAGGSGGTVLFERLPPQPAQDSPWRADVWSSHGSWHRDPELGADVAWTRGSAYLRAAGERRRIDSYHDGDGETVRSAFDSDGLNLMLGFGRAATGLAELGVEATRTDDALFAGAGMDSPEDSNDTLRLKVRREDRLGGWTDLRADVYLSNVDHLMDNYSLRPLTAPMAMRVPSTSDTFGGRVSGDREVGERLRWTFGVDHQQNRREALRYAGPDPGRVVNLQSVMWPDATLVQSGLFLEGERSFGAASRLRFGGRVDRFTASAAKADLAPAGMSRSPNRLYQLYYGFSARDRTDHEVSALLRYERQVSPGVMLFAGLSRSVRAADATERYLGADNPNGTMRWVGNPRLAPSKHHQLDSGVAATGQRGEWSVSGFVDQVDHFILRDRARGQEGILATDGASIYRNVGARLVGIELEGSGRLGGGVEMEAAVSWVRGENRTDERPLAQIPPLQGRLAMRYAGDRWLAGLGLRGTARQNRVDDDPLTGSGLDFGPTPGYAVADLSGSYRIAAGLSLTAGVDNLLDRAYADHLNRSNLFDPDPVRVNEPGRTLWVRLSWSAGAAR